MIALLITTLRVKLTNRIKKQKRVGFYGGTFDPIHFGHISLAVEMLEEHGLDEIWFCPASLNPHKQDRLPTVSTEERLAMLKLAIQDIPQCHLLENEIQKEGPSYTVETLRELIDDYRIKSKSSLESLQLYLILGDDAVPGFFHWREADEIVKLVSLLIGKRIHLTSEPELKGHLGICAAIEKGFTPSRIIEVSSSELRVRLAERRYCGHLIPAKVLDYIYAHDLYLGNINQKSKP